MFPFQFLFSLTLRAMKVIPLLAILSGLQPGFSQKGISLNLDLAVYRYSESQPYLDIYYSFPISEVAYVGNTQTGYASRVLMTMQIFKQDSLWAAKQWKVEDTLADMAGQDSSSQMVDALRYVIEEPDRYRVVLYARDMNRPEQIDSVSSTIDVRSFSQEDLALSDIALATNIQKKTPNATEAFVKNNFEVVPNPGRLFGAGSPNLYYYFECYNMSENVPGAKYKTRCFVKNSNGEREEGVIAPDRTKKKLADASMEMGMINVSKLPSGTYALVYGVADTAGALLASNEKRFYVYNPQVPIAAPAAGGQAVFPIRALPALEALSEKQLNEEFEQMTHLTSRDEKKFYKSLTSASGKRQFIQSLWESPKPTFQMTGRALREEYLSRVEKANGLYTNAFRPGWKTDRGRVYILYGPPSDVQRFSSTQETKPYEVWTYQELQGGVEFIFADRYGFKNYELIHSTLRGELSNSDWRELIETRSGVMPRQ
jgi:GWxTD domain-containing protein